MQKNLKQKIKNFLVKKKEKHKTVKYFYNDNVFDVSILFENLNRIYKFFIRTTVERLLCRGRALRQRAVLLRPYENSALCPD